MTDSENKPGSLSAEGSVSAEGSEPRGENTYTKTALVNALILGIFAVGIALVLSLTYSGTKERIAESQRLAEEKALLEVIGDQSFDNNLLEDILVLSDSQRGLLNVTADSKARVLRMNGNILGFIFPAVAPDGYSGKMHLLIGVGIDGTLMGVRVVKHKETPGLGDKVDIQKSDWILGFAGKSLLNPEPNGWAVKKDGGEFDAFTGATITPRAVVKMIKQTLIFTESERQRLIEAATEEEEVQHDG